jgi:hypothetical protein
MNDFKLTFTLKQHTPIIHFQHDQYGATIRASELKPKLDRFLIKKFKEHHIDYCSWLIKGQSEAFSYKIKIVVDQTSIDLKLIGTGRNDGYPTYFANMGNEFKKNPKGTSYSEKIFLIDFFCFNDLVSKIREYFPEFLAKTNFGTRQNKGFGSFYLDKSTDCFIPIERILKNYYYFEINEIKDEIVFGSIDYYYKRLKSGVNENFNDLCRREPNCDPNKYKKSYLFKYLCSLTSKGWEKRKIKEDFFGIYKDYNEKYFIRALLGTPGSYSYKPTLEPCHKKVDTIIGSTYKILDDYEIEVTHPQIERFKSPITFKPIKFQGLTRIYIIHDFSYNVIMQYKKQPFSLYKKFIPNLVFIYNGRLKFSKGSPFPNIKGSTTDVKDMIINKLKEQEQTLNDFRNINSKIADYSKRQNNECILNTIIQGQKDRFENFILECSLSEKYFPPKKDILLLDIDFDIYNLISEYNETELKNEFQFSYDRQEYLVSIKKVNKHNE